MVRILITLLSAGLMAATLFAYGGGLAWTFDLLSHLRPFYLLGAAALLPLTAVRRWRRPAGWLLWPVLIINGLHVAGYYLPPRPPDPGAPSVGVMTYNVLYGNRPIAELVDLIESTQPDLILLQEVDQTFLDSLAPLYDAYPYELSLPKPGPFGIALLSRFPLQDSAIIPHESGNHPSLRAEFSLGNRDVLFLGIHPPPPISSGNSDARNRIIADIAARAGHYDGPVIVAGDFNTSPWSAPMQTLFRTTDLRDSRRGFGVNRTLEQGILRVMIDHVLISPDFDVLDHTTGPRLGSDHFPVKVTLALRPTADR